MSLAMPVLWDDRCRLHDPAAEIWVGVRTPATETAERVDAMCDAVVAAGCPLVVATRHRPDAVLAVHDASLLDYLASAWADWAAAGLPEDPGQDRVVPYVFAHAGLTSAREPATPAAVWARPGLFTYDTMTLVGPGPGTRPAAPSMRR